LEEACLEQQPSGENEMIHSMFTAITSLNAFQTYMDVIADNISNANTTGYKPNRMLFQDQYAQLLNAGAAPNDVTGGVNPNQIGSGVKMGTITPNFTQGLLRSTGRNLDLSMQGDGFFTYRQGTALVYSRDGALDVDSNGYLVNSSSGLRLEGWSIPIGGTGTINTNQPPSDLQVPLDLTLARATSEVVFGGNINSNVLTFDTTIGVYDSLGDIHSVTLHFERPDIATDTWDVTSTTAGVTGSGTVTYGPDGQVTGTTGLAFSVDNSTIVAADIDFDLVLTNSTMLSATSDLTATSQDGLSAGSIAGINVAANTGELYVTFSNGLRQKFGQMAITRFSNPAGLIREGQNLFTSGTNSGLPQIGGANTGGRGPVISGYLEDSKVDMGQEFTNLIVAQRGFQASARVVTAADEITMELVNLKR
jgi:flagellar hook protein FlgE